MPSVVLTPRAAACIQYATSTGCVPLHMVSGVHPHAHPSISTQSVHAHTHTHTRTHTHTHCLEQMILVGPRFTRKLP